ncbi:MFS transporter, FHS family, L-fucose permease [Filimonas lacunae]|uniref:MFS transporter, FHS family, L-fucose permease n=1 Tax=Filimonas lacunae TaxID=477680 RepID=A0A173MHB6_9BACT|nr:L-fucose:H+ symporter permease [Filimonas lacunae]BAV07003.1 L-fucose transporter [Filimonas lacunae]SIS96564.1 MFS transporter, FHS family, L-fucose permease [Filimonas lacunae]
MTQKTAFTEKKFIVTFIFVTSLFLLWGVAHSISDVLNKHFQNVLQLSKSQSGLIQFSVFGAYFFMSIPAGLFMKRFGYKNGVMLGLLLFALGAFLFVPAANRVSFPFFRFALFILGCGMATLETVAHPFIAALGQQQTSDRRINFSQSFNALGTMIGPALGSNLLLAGATGTGNLTSVKTLYTGIAGVLVAVALAFAFVKVPALSAAHELHADEAQPDAAPGKKLLHHHHFVWAAIAQFFNVAAQAGTWGFFINYGHDVMGFSDARAGNYMILFMAMMALGRIAGTWLMKFIAPNKLLAAFAFGSMVMCCIVAQGWGWVSFSALLMINFFFSIMFPTIFSLGLKSLGRHTQQASSFISMGVVGGAFFPFVMGLIANHNVATAYYLPVVCYLVIFLFAVRFYQVKQG